MRNLSSRGLKLDPNRLSLTSRIGLYICINDHMFRDGEFDKTAILPCCPKCSAQGKKQVILRPLSVL
jgi:hypothetical protein